MSASPPLLQVRDLSVRFVRRGAHRRRVTTRAVDGVSFDVAPGEIVGLVGESGCGKTVTSLAVMGLLPRRGVRVDGRVLFDGADLMSMSPGQLRARRGRDLAMVFQDPMSSLNPVLSIGVQVTEVLRRHTGLGRAAAAAEAEALLGRVGIPDPGRRLRGYPHQMSGGMRQRTLIAIALACRPRLLIADEPTTALDVTIQAQVLELLRRLVRETGTAMLLITHDLGVVAGLCDRVAVLYAGRIVEQADGTELFARPRHQYTAGLLACVPRLDTPREQPLRPIRGSALDVLAWSAGCAFAPRCPAADQACRRADLPLLPDGPRREHHVRCVHPVEAATSPAPAADGTNA